MLHVVHDLANECSQAIQCGHHRRRDPDLWTNVLCERKSTNWWTSNKMTVIQYQLCWLFVVYSYSCLPDTISKTVTHTGEIGSENVTSWQKTYDNSPPKTSVVNLPLTLATMFLISIDIIYSMSLIYLRFFKEIHWNSEEQKNRKNKNHITNQ